LSGGISPLTIIDFRRVEQHVEIRSHVTAAPDLDKARAFERCQRVADSAAVSVIVDRSPNALSEGRD
jgi:hypothetical protein